MRISTMLRKTADWSNLNQAILTLFLATVLCHVSWAQGDNLWNLRENGDDRFHSNEAWLRPWRVSYDDGWGQWVGGYSYELQWGSVSTFGNSDGSFTISRGRDHQFHAWTHVYCETAKTISFSGSGDCVPMVFLNNPNGSGMGFPATLNLNAGWNRIDITGYNQNDSYTFSCGALATLVDVMNTSEVALNQPPVPDADGPYVEDEGTPVIFDASGSHDPDGDPLLYRWDFDDDGIWDTGWVSNPIEVHTWFDDWVGVARLEVSDDEFTDTATTSVTINNVAPAPDAGPGQTVNEGDTVNFTGDFWDPGIFDVHVIDWDFGDGDTVDGTLVTTHEYGDNGSYTATLTVSDDDGGIGNDTTLITVNNVQPDVVIDSVDQPNPNFILPHHILTFMGSFSDPGWLDAHVALWDFDDGTTAPGVVVEENDPPNATGQSVEDHAYLEPGTYDVTLTIIDDDGGMGDSAQWTVTVVNPGQAVQALDDYIQGLEADAFKNNASQRKKALHNSLEAVVDLIEAGEYQDDINKLRNDIRAKADGLVDGHPNNDWITDQTAQEAICAMIDDIVANLNL